MPWLLIDSVPQKVNGFRYVSANRGIFSICSYRQSGSMIMFSTVSGQRITVLTIVPLFYLLEIQTMRELKKQYSDINSRMPLQSCQRLYQLGD